VLFEYLVPLADTGFPGRFYI